MISKVTAFTTSLGNLFKSKDEVLKAERRDILGKFLTREVTVTEDRKHNPEYCGYYPSWDSHPKYLTTFTTKEVPDETTIGKFLDNYDDIMIKFKELDNAQV